MDPLAMMEEKYHLVVTVGYSILIAIIMLVLKTSVAERLVLWVLGVLFFASVLRGIRKGVDAPPKFEL
jgi:uncharacterized membrane protein